MSIPNPVDVRQQVNNELLLRQLKRIGLTGLGLGVAARGAQGVYNSLRRGAGIGHAPPTPRLLPIPTKQKQDEDEEPRLPPYKMAGFFDDMFSGRRAQDVMGHPLALSGLLLTGAGALGGGWKLTDMLLDRDRRAAMAGELNEAKREYERALLGANDKEASELGRELDGLYDDLLAHDNPPGEKTALDFGDLTGRTANLLLAGWLPLAIGSGLVAHNLTAGRRQQSVLQKALQQRHSQQLASSPFFAYPSAVGASPNNAMATATEDEEEQAAA